MDKLLLVTTGGTIAGKATHASDLTGYEAGAIPAEELITAVPELVPYGPFEILPFSSIDSSDMTLCKWLSLAKQVEKELARSDIKGTVILHGTDTMEEGAYFLHLTVHTEKPIVFTGAMRPATALSADGPMNLLQSVQVASHGASKGQGVLVVFDGLIHGARNVQKIHTTCMDAFGNYQYGALGVVQDGEVEFVQTSTKVHTFQSEFSLDTLEDLPKVEILTNYGGIDPAILEGILATKPECIILAGMGHGILPTPIRERATKAYPIMVRTSRVGTGKVSPLHSMGSFLYGGTLSAPKLRILLSLALTKTKEKLILQDYINRY